MKINLMLAIVKEMLVAFAAMVLLEYFMDRVHYNLLIKQGRIIAAMVLHPSLYFWHDGRVIKEYD